MRKVDDKYVSEGKLLEVIPIIEDAVGRPMMLPPVVWHVENWVLGFMDEHQISTPLQFWTSQKTVIPGSFSSAPHRVTFMVRILEDGEMPSHAPGQVDSTAVKDLLQAIRIAPDVYPG